MRKCCRCSTDPGKSVISVVFCLVAIALSATAATAPDGPEPGSPCTHQFDTGATAAEPLPAAALARALVFSCYPELRGRDR